MKDSKGHGSNARGGSASILDLGRAASHIAQPGVKGGKFQPNPNYDPKYGTLAQASARAVVAPHAGVKSVNTHVGSQVATLNARTNSLDTTHGGRRRAVAESIARGIRADRGFARVR